MAVAMAPSEFPPTRRWRYFLAARNLAPPSSPRTPNIPCHRRPRPAHEDQSLASFVSSISSPDLVVKTEALHQLSLFLLYLCPNFETSFSCPDAFTISFAVTNEEILVPLKDIEALYRVLFSELASYTDWLFKQDKVKSGYDHGLRSDVTDSLCDGIHLMILVKVLRCCIRTLPLLEYDTSLSLVAAEILMSLLKQFHCPARLAIVVSQGLRDVDFHKNEVYFHKFSSDSCDPSNSPVSYFSLAQASMEDLQEHFLALRSRKDFSVNPSEGNDMPCCIHNSRRKTDRTQISCALLEVFMDELLLEPGLAHLLLASNPNADLEPSTSEFTCTRSTQMAMEAAAAHFILFTSQSNYMQTLQGNFYATHSSYLGLGLSLPAAVVLLDLVVFDRMCVPEVFFSHIINTLIMTFSNNCSCLIPELPGGMVLNLAGSALETAVNIYFRICTSPTVYSEFSSVCDNFEALYSGNLSVGSVLQLLFNELQSKSPQSIIHFSYIGDVTTCHNMELERSLHVDSACYYTRQGAVNNTFQGRNQIFHVLDYSSHTQSTCVESNQTALVFVLRLISSSLLYLVAEANKDDLQSKKIGRPERDTQGACSSVDAEKYLNYATEAFKVCFSNNTEETWKNLKLDSHMQKVFSRADKVIRNVFSFFINKLHWNLKQNAPKALCQAYMDVLKSLLTLTVSVDQRNNGHPPDDNLLYENASMENTEEISDKVQQNTGKNLENSTEEKSTKPISDQVDQNDELMSSTLIITRRYQHKRQCIISRTELTSQNEVKVSGSSLAQGSGILKRPKPRLRNETNANDGKPYIEEMLAREGELDGECFDDLTDFIVCKAGRDYSLWMKSHMRKRKKKLRKTYWERLKARKALVSLLTSKGQYVT